ncbi:MAG: hypothetical protein ABFD60_07995 [Bryobacteraceae bacterium]
MKETALEIAYACWEESDREFRAARAVKELSGCLTLDVYENARAEAAKRFSILVNEANKANKAKEKDW